MRGGGERGGGVERKDKRREGVEREGEMEREGMYIRGVVRGDERGGDGEKG